MMGSTVFGMTKNVIRVLSTPTYNQSLHRQRKKKNGALPLAIFLENATRANPRDTGMGFAVPLGDSLTGDYWRALP
jgi:hypothetical protein